MSDEFNLFLYRINLLLGSSKKTHYLPQQELLTFTNLLKTLERILHHNNGTLKIQMDLQGMLCYQNLLILSRLVLILTVRMKMKFFLYSEENQTVGCQVLMSARLRQVGFLNNEYYTGVLIRWWVDIISQKEVQYDGPVLAPIPVGLLIILLPLLICF